MGSEEYGVFGIGAPALPVEALFALPVEYQSVRYGIVGNIIAGNEIKWSQAEAKSHQENCPGEQSHRLASSHFALTFPVQLRNSFPWIRLIMASSGRLSGEFASNS